MRRHNLLNFSSSQRDSSSVNTGINLAVCIRKEDDVNILNPIIGIIAVSFFSIIVLPIALVIFFLGIAGLVAMVGPRKKPKRSQKLQILTVAEQT
jgi:hypothetical protein